MKRINLIIWLAILIFSPEGLKGEGIYIHTDRSCYLPGEFLLFKAYVFERADNKPVSKDTLYIALVDQFGTEVANGSFPADNSLIMGNIELPEVLSEGSYVLLGGIGPRKNIIPQGMFSKLIEIRESDDPELCTKISLPDSLYKTKTGLIARLVFTGSDMRPVPATYKYVLTGKAGDVSDGKGKGDVKGATLNLQLPDNSTDADLKLIVESSFKGSKVNTGMKIPTVYQPSGSDNIAKENKASSLNITLTADSKSYRKDQKVVLSIAVTDGQGSPVKANLSVSASNQFPGSTDPECIVLPCTQKSSNSSMGIDGNTGRGALFSLSVRSYFVQALLEFAQAPGTSYIIQEKNNLKKFRKKPLAVTQTGYPSDLTPMQLLMQIRPYHLENGKITFGGGTMNSINNQDGALIVIDGIKQGTDASILQNLSVPDIANIRVSTNLMDVQRYSAMNNVGVIEVTMKKNEDFSENEVKGKSKTNTLLWAPEVITDNSGKTSIEFQNNKSATEVLVVVYGVSAKGVPGISTLRYTVVP